MAGVTLQVRGNDAEVIARQLEKNSKAGCENLRPACYRR